jgi:mycothiol synthase
MPQQLQMIWPGRAVRIPEQAISNGYAIRPLQDGDESGHVRVMHKAGFTSWTEAQLDTWRRTIALPHGIFVAVHEGSGAIVATAQAAHRPTDLHPSGGELGWVAADPAHAGKELGMAVCIAALRRFLDAGYDTIYLLTDDHRLAAIRTYLKMGLVPFLCATDMEQRWKAVVEKLDWPAEPDTWARAPSGLWIREQTEERPDSDRVERYAPRHTWLPNRPHRGFSCDGDMDAFGDESLYRPSRLGCATVTPGDVEAGARSALTITFIAGPAAVPENATVTFAMRGQSPLGRLPDFALSCSGSCDVEKQPCGFRVMKGTLAEGEQVTLAWPAFQWTPLAGRREFKVVVNYGDDRPEQRLPEPLVIRVGPKALSRLEATVPATHPAGSDIRVQLTARDEYDNRVPYAGQVAVDAGNGETLLRMVDGFGSCRLRPASGIATRVSAKAPVGSCTSNPSVHEDGLQLFVGDLHCHDFLSEAEGYPDAVYRWAIEDRGLDFISVVPQSHGWHDNETWTLVKYMNERYLDEGRFVTFLGFEWQHTGYGDKVVHFLGGDQPYLPVDDARYRSAAGLYAALRGSDALAVSHHPCYPRGSWCSSTDFDAVETDIERLVELWSMHGSSEGYDPADRPFADFDPDRLVMAALKRGLRLGFTGGSDTHSGRPGGSAKEPYPHWGGLTGVWADRLSRRDLFQALYARRTYALTHARIVLRFAVNGQPMGSETGLSETADIQVDAWAPSAIAKVEILKNACLLRAFGPFGDACRFELTDRTGGPAFYHCRVTLADGNLAVCSPVWLG